VGSIDSQSNDILIQKQSPIDFERSDCVCCPLSCKNAFTELNLLFVPLSISTFIQKVNWGCDSQLDTKPSDEQQQHSYLFLCLHVIWGILLDIRSMIILLFISTHLMSWTYQFIIPFFFNWIILYKIPKWEMIWWRSSWGSILVNTLCCLTPCSVVMYGMLSWKSISSFMQRFTLLL